EAAIWACLTAEAQGAALAAFQQTAVPLLAQPFLMLGCGGMLVGIEGPFDMVLGQAVLEYGAAVVEHDCITLSLDRPQHATDHLRVQPHLFGRPCEDATANLGHIPTLGQHHTVGYELRFAGLQAREHGIALVLRRAAVDVLGTDTEIDEFIP